MPINPKDFRPKFLEGVEFNTSTEVRYCRKCPTKLGPSVKFYCSGMCINTAKADGTYGKETV